MRITPELIEVFEEFLLFEYGLKLDKLCKGERGRIYQNEQLIIIYEPHGVETHYVLFSPDVKWVERVNLQFKKLIEDSKEEMENEIGIENE